MKRMSEIKTEHEAAVYLMIMIMSERALPVVEQLQHADMLADTVIELNKILEKHYDVK